MSQITIYDTSSIIGDVETLTADTGGAVSPDGAGNINILGDGESISTTGDPGTNTITVSNPFVVVRAGSTVGAVTGDVFTYTLANDSAVTLHAIIAAAKEDYTEAFGGSGTGTARKAGAGAAVEAVENTSWDSNDDVSVDAAFVTSGNDYILRVTGSADETWNWTAYITVVVEDS